MPGWINIPIKIETHQRLNKVREKEQSFDKFINKLLDLNDLIMRESNYENKYRAKD